MKTTTRALARGFKPRNKYGAVRRNGYASIRESQYAELLAAGKANGEVSHWLEQIPVRLSIGKITLDFLVFRPDGSHVFVEIKGKETRDYKLRMLALQNEHPQVYAALEVLS